MADFEAIIRKHVGEDGNIPTTAINAIVSAIKTAVGNEYVDKERYKAKLTELDSMKEQVQDAKDSATTAEKWKTKYDALKADFADFKTETERKETHATKEGLYRQILRDAGISEKRIDAVLRVSDIDGIELDNDGKVKGASDLRESIKKEWADFIVKTSELGADVAKPPENNPAKPTYNSRAAELAKRFTESRYGTMKEGE